jgi:acetyl/propionyl-CoA carboxylase alpha subunit
MRRALAEYHVGGIKTNLPFHRKVMRHPAFIAGETDTGFIERHKAALLPATPDEEAAELAAIIAAAHARENGAGGDASGDLDLSQVEIPAWRREK